MYNSSAIRSELPNLLFVALIIRDQVASRDEFVAPYDSQRVEPARLNAAIEETGYSAQVISGKWKRATGTAPLSVPCGFAPLGEAFAQAQKEIKPVVPDFFAEWRAPCQRMEKTTLDFSLLFRL